MAYDYNCSVERIQNSVSIVAGYVATDQDSADAGVTTYFGFVDSDGSWYIQKQVVSGNTMSWRFARGSGAYSSAWTNRTSLTYDIFNVVF